MVTYFENEMEENNPRHRFFHALIENSSHVILLVDENLNDIFKTPSLSRILSAPGEYYENISVYEYLHPGDKEKFKNTIIESLANPGSILNVVVRLKHKNGNYLWFEALVTNQLSDKDINGVMVDLHDVSKRKEVELKITKINRLYHFISQLNQMIVRVTDEETLFKEACQIAVGQNDFGMAWIGIINEKTKILEPVIHSGLDIDFLSTLKIIIDENATAKSNAPVAELLMGKTVCSNNINVDPSMKPWRIEAIKRGYLSALAIPIKKSGKVIGSYNLYAPAKNFFESEEIALLEQATGDISFALDFFNKERLRKKAEQAAVESGRRYKTLAEMSPVGIFHTDETGYTTYVNPVWCNISGLPCEEALGNGWLNAVHPKDRKKLLDGWMQATKHRKLSVSEYRFLRPDGSIAWVIGQAVPEINSHNQVIGYVGTITDITERKIAEEEIKRSNIQLALSQKIAHIGYWELDLNNQANYWSEEMYRIVGIDTNQKPPDLDTYLLHIHPDDRDMVLEAHRSVIYNDQQLNIEFRFMRPDEIICNFYSLGNLNRDANGNPLRIVGITQDITERKKNENDILKEKHLSDSIINSLPGAFYLYTRDGKFLRWNKNFEKITRYTGEEIRSMAPTDFFHEDEKKIIETKISNTFSFGEGHVEANFLLKTKERIPFYFTGIAIDYEGHPCLMGVGIDISERVDAQEKMMHTSEQLRQLALHLQTIRDEERKRIGREIHDELGQQVTAIKMDVAWIDKNIPEKTSVVKNKLKNIIGLLDISNQSIRRILNELRSGILDDHDLLEAIEWLGNQFTANTGIPVKLAFPEKGIIATPPIANCIFRLYQEAFTNITRYARATNVNVSLTAHGQVIMAIVEDNGVGFDPTCITGNKSFGILGMKERVLSLGGEFELTSAPGRGTKISLILPYVF
ncbi:MAG: PAS domain S-box protein [Ginsengibacter sp.]